MNKNPTRKSNSASATTSQDLARISRTPPTPVRRHLRQEVGFGCPVEGCGNPYLEYHHFDPEWHVLNHHNPDGMIALCATHHAKAGAWTVEQCRELKHNPSASEVHGHFEWRRREIVAIIGGNYYYETPRMVVFQGEPLVWFERDDRGELRLNLKMLSISGQPRTELTANDWIIQGDPIEVYSPPSGRLLRVTYANGDDFQIEFKVWKSPELLERVHPALLGIREKITFPLVTAEARMTIGGTLMWFNSRESRVGGTAISGLVISGGEAGLAFE